MNCDCGYMCSYHSKMKCLHIFIPTYVGALWAKMCIYDHFFYFRLFDVSARMSSKISIYHTIGPLLVHRISKISRSVMPQFD